MCRIFPRKDRLLISIQGLCAVYANAYFADLPEGAIHRVTLRDFLKRDSIVEQQRKFVQRGKMETQAVKLAVNLSGRTEWDKYYVKEWNPQARYYSMNETLRPGFYKGVWRREDCIPYSIFLSQGDYPVKGLHYMIEALPAIRAVFPKTRVYVAGNSIVNYKTLKEKLKISAYGKYLRERIRENGLADSIVFLGKLNAEQMKERYLKSHLFVCCSSIENSPNSLGEAMLLGVPCVSADVGGVPSMFTHGEDGILYEGFRTPQNGFDKITQGEDGNRLQMIAGRLAEAVVRMWKDDRKMAEYCKNAREHAKRNHDRERNYKKMKEIYANIVGSET